MIRVFPVGQYKSALPRPRFADADEPRAAHLACPTLIIIAEHDRVCYTFSRVGLIPAVRPGL